MPYDRVLGTLYLGKGIIVRKDDSPGRIPEVQSEVDREQLVLNHLPLIKSLARRLGHLLPPSVELSDLVSAGVVGFIDALARYNPKQGAKLQTFAEFRIRGAMLDCLRGLDWAPRSLRRWTRQLERVFRALEQRLGRPPTAEELCGEMKVDLDKLNRMASEAHGATLDSLEGSTDPSGLPDRDCRRQSAVSAIRDLPLDQYETSEIREILVAAVASLPRQQRIVISLRYFEELSVLEIARTLRVNSSRVSQLHMKALCALRGMLSELVAAA